MIVIRRRIVFGEEIVVAGVRILARDLPALLVRGQVPALVASVFEIGSRYSRIRHDLDLHLAGKDLIPLLRQIIGERAPFLIFLVHGEFDRDRKLVFLNAALLDRFVEIIERQRSVEPVRAVLFDLLGHGFAVVGFPVRESGLGSVSRQIVDVRPYRLHVAECRARRLFAVDRVIDRLAVVHAGADRVFRVLAVDIETSHYRGTVGVEPFVVDERIERGFVGDEFIEFAVPEFIHSVRHVGYDVDLDGVVIEISAEPVVAFFREYKALFRIPLGEGVRTGTDIFVFVSPVRRGESILGEAFRPERLVQRRAARL